MRVEFDGKEQAKILGIRVCVPSGAPLGVCAQVGSTIGSRKHKFVQIKCAIFLDNLLCVCTHVGSTMEKSKVSFIGIYVCVQCCASAAIGRFLFSTVKWKRLLSVCGESALDDAYLKGLYWYTGLQTKV